MNQRTAQYKEIRTFLSKYSILQHNEGSTIIASQSNTYLIKNIEMSNYSSRGNNEQLTEIINTLSQHQTFNSKNIMSLIDFEIIFSKTKTQSQIRAVYQYGQKSLGKEIQERKQSEQHFEQEALWGLLYSIASPLGYLEEKNVIYGVIDASRVFLDNNLIAILDPSSTGIDPYEINANRLYSPQLLSQQRCIEQIEMFKSDIFALGLLMLQCALLKMQLYSYDENVIGICLTEIKDIYSENLCQLIESMLNFNPETRPSFQQILREISELFDISLSEQPQNIQPMCPDLEDQCNHACVLDEFSEKENIDILETEYVRFEDNRHHSSVNDFQKSKVRFCSALDSRLSESPIQEGSQYSQTSSLFIEESIVKSFEKSRRIYKAKQIKDKLIKNTDFIYQSQQPNDIHQTNANFHRRSKTTWQNQHVIPLQNNNTQPGFESMRNHSSSLINNFNPQLRSKDVAKQNNSFNQNYSNQRGSQSRTYASGSLSPLNKQNLFTKPEIMNMIKNDIKKIQQKKKNGLSVHFSYFPNEEKEIKEKNFSNISVGMKSNEKRR